VPSDNGYVSRNHLQVELDGWLVLATDLGSRGGTTLRAAGREPERIRAGDRYIWEPGHVLDLADSYEILFEVLPDDAPDDAGPAAVDGT
jgi:pSer/pThr/pTyr-binding forkhead associated (FHA) protein